jgi:hypothetical protein
MERMQQKTARLNQMLTDTKQHWEEVCWRLICRYFGGNTNGESFEQIATGLPLQILGKHKNQIHQLEALLLGQAGLLHNRFSEHYPQMLFKEYQFLQKKYGLRVVNKPPAFLRMRPVNFPTIRLAQLAMLIHQSKHLFASLCDAVSVEEIMKLLDVTANDYWHTHYRPDEESAHLPKHLGKQAVETILVNAICPLLFAYGKYTAQPAQVNKVLQWLQLLPDEANHITRSFATVGIKVKNAFDSQALIQLKKEYCDARRCLECAVGTALLRSNSPAVQAQS